MYVHFTSAWKTKESFTPNSIRCWGWALHYVRMFFADGAGILQWITSLHFFLEIRIRERVWRSSKGRVSQSVGSRNRFVATALGKVEARAGPLEHRYTHTCQKFTSPRLNWFAKCLRDSLTIIGIFGRFWMSKDPVMNEKLIKFCPVFLGKEAYTFKAQNRLAINNRTQKRHFDGINIPKW